MLALLLIAAASPAAAAPTSEPVEIVVRATRRKCRVQLADKVLSERQLAARAETWDPSQAVRVVTPSGTGYKCLARIAFRLSDRGIRLVEFVERPGLR